MVENGNQDQISCVESKRFQDSYKAIYSVRCFSMFFFSMHFKVQELDQEDKRLQSDLNQVNATASQQVRYSV